MLSGVVTVTVATRGDVVLDMVDVVVRIATIEVAACEALRKSVVVMSNLAAAGVPSS